MPSRLAIDFALPLGGADDLAVVDVDAVAQALAHRNRAPLACRSWRDALGRSRAPFVVDADHRDTIRLHAGDQPLLDRGVMLERAVAVEMVLADIDAECRRADRASARDRSDRTSTRPHGRGPARGGLQRQHRGADVAAEVGGAAGGLQQMMDQRRGGGLAVGAGDGDERRVRRELAPLAAEQLDVADDLDAGFLRQHPPTSAAPDASAARPARARSAETFDQSMLRRSAVAMPAARALSMLAALSSKAITSAPPATSACALASPEPPRPNTATFFPAKLVTGIIAASAWPARRAPARSR